jgi:hypothetical protein
MAHPYSSHNHPNYPNLHSLHGIGRSGIEARKNHSARPRLIAALTMKDPAKNRGKKSQPSEHAKPRKVGLPTALPKSRMGANRQRRIKI